jgi:hypothetical protein
MGTIAEIELPVEEFVLRESLRALSDVTFEVIPVAAHLGADVVPYVRATGSSLDRLDEVLAADPSVADVRLLEDLGGERLYRMCWREDVDLVSFLLEAGATVLDAYGGGDRWHLRILFPDRDSLSSTHAFADDEGIEFNIKRIHGLEGPVGGGEFGLTEEQYEVLVTAVEKGYFDVPREVTMAELADRLGVTQQSLSERLRRAHKRLIDGALHVDGTTFSDA